MKNALSLLSILLLLRAGFVIATDDPTPRPPQSEEAKQAKTRFDEAMAAAKKQYLKDLDLCLKAALKAEQLDEAIRIRAWRELIEASRETPVGKVSATREGAVAFGGSQYRIFLADVSWTGARDACRKLGGELASVDSKEKREFLSKQSGSVQLWVGAFVDQRTSRWFWANGNPVAPGSWQPGRPENNGPHAVMFGKSGLIGDGKNELPDCKGYICEWKK